MLNDGLAIPVIKQSLYASIFALIAGNVKKALEYLVEYFNTLTTLDLEQFKSIGYSSLLNIVAKQYETLARNYVRDDYEKRSVWHFFNAMSDANSEYYCKQLTVSSRKALAYHIYKKKEGSNSQWHQSIPDTKQYIDITDKLFSLWSTFQPDKCDFQSLYTKPYLFFKWLHFLSEEVHKKVYIIMESTSSKAASKGYVYRKLKEIPCMIDEYLTSQICNKYKARNLENVSTANSKRRVHAILKCQETTCNRAWNRDVMAANNILDIFLHAANNDNNRLAASDGPLLLLYD